MTGLLPDYSLQAVGYDETRAASASVLEPLKRALAGSRGPRLADVGGGTGNYAAALARDGWEPVVVDLSAGMLDQAAAKGLDTVAADAASLPFADGAFDAVILVSMLHHVEDRAAVLAEAQRILAPGGRLALMVFTREDAESLWLLDLFPSSRPWMMATHPPLSELLALLPGARVLPVRFTDLEDANTAALSAHPEKLLEKSWRDHTSYFERMERDHPTELQNGLEQLASMVENATAPRLAGTATVLAWSRD